MKKKLIAILSIISIINVFSFNLNAAELDSRNSECLNAAIQFISRISQDLPLFFDWKSAEPINEKYLYDETGKVKKAIIYNVYNNSIDKGYIILDCNTYKILEFSKNNSPYGELLNRYIKEKKITNIQDEYFIYSPGTHAVAIKSTSSTQYSVYEFTNDPSVGIDLYSEKSSAIPSQTVANAVTIIDENAINTAEISPLATGVHSKILTGVPDASYTISCIPAAIGNVIGYWDTHGYSNLISASNTIYDAINEVNSNLIAVCGNNTTNSAIPTATQNYCKASGRYPNNFTVTNVWSPSYSSFSSQIDYSRPALIGFASGNNYYNGGAHMTAGMGYYYDDAFPNEKYIYVHDAWSSTPTNYMVLWSSYNDFMAKIVP